MEIKEILKLKEGPHVIVTNEVKSVVIRLREGFTLTTIAPGHKLLIERYSERGNLLWEECVEDIFHSQWTENGDEVHEDPDCRAGQTPPRCEYRQ